MVTTVPCHGRPELFESVFATQHREAAALCATCPAIDACAALLADTMRDYGYGPHYGPRGTWAGRLVGTPAVTVVRRGSAA